MKSYLLQQGADTGSAQKVVCTPVQGQGTCVRRYTLMISMCMLCTPPANLSNQYCGTFNTMLLVFLIRHKLLGSSCHHIAIICFKNGRTISGSLNKAFLAHQQAGHAGHSAPMLPDQTRTKRGAVLHQWPASFGGRPTRNSWSFCLISHQMSNPTCRVLQCESQPCLETVQLLSTHSFVH